ncbi:Protein CBG03618 [Caenorhabditis briggsae]|uniref:Uncharacterized protein n=2 Tax=Caenorhabditis briggsae TaxID=6238 RepID=A0AAE9DEF2_CAEBR|nr:Protein CBG03618 [Caenorhabditis briggsae]ULU02580.1 hypothetical protein L3Y34_002277 [Caenorhabditis briggsae]CAP24479.1 Protein CBG03618 [Caenorhabditis briggsae]
MGAKIVKLINEDSSVEDNDFDRIRDLEEGEDSSTWDSSTSSNGEEEEEDYCTSEYKMASCPQDPYIVEKRFVAGSNEFFYNIVKRK